MSFPSPVDFIGLKILSSSLITRLIQKQQLKKMKFVISLGLISALQTTHYCSQISLFTKKVPRPFLKFWVTFWIRQSLFRHQPSKFTPSTTKVCLFNSVSSATFTSAESSWSKLFCLAPRYVDLCFKKSEDQFFILQLVRVHSSSRFLPSKVSFCKSGIIPSFTFIIALMLQIESKG